MCKVFILIKRRCRKEENTLNKIINDFVIGAKNELPLEGKLSTKLTDEVEV